MSVMESKFKEDGFLILEQFLSNDEIENIYSEIESILDQQIPEKMKSENINRKWLWLKRNKPALKSHAYNLFGKLGNVMKAVTKEKIITLIEKLLGSSVLIDKIQIRVDDMSNDRNLPMHQERGQISKKEITFWLPLIDINEESGGVKIVKNSHKLGNLKVHIYDKEKMYTGVEPEILEDKKIENVYMNAGDLLVFHWNLIHGTFPNNSDEIRYCIVARFNSVYDVPYITDENAPMDIPKLV